jgi:hypothetical protein
VSVLPWTEPTAGDHPRVWVESVSALVTRKNGTHAAYWTELQSYANSHLATATYPNSWFDDKDGEYTGIFAFSYLLDNSKTLHAGRGRDIALYLATKNIPGGSTKRDYLMAMVFVYDWLYAFLTTAQRTTLRTRISDYIETMYQFHDGEYLWGVSHGEMVFAAIGLIAIMADGTSTENSRWRSRMESIMTHLDDGTNASFFPGFRYFGVESSTHKGSGSWSYMNVQEWFYAALFPALKSGAGFDWRTEGESWWEDTIEWQIWNLRRGDGNSTFWRQHECRGLSLFSIYAYAHAVQIADVNTGTFGRIAQWLGDLVDSQENAVFGPWNMYAILWRNAARSPLEPTTANTGGNEMRVFNRAGKVCFRGSTPTGGAWGTTAIEAIWNFGGPFTEGHQQRRAGQFQIGGYGSRVLFEHGHYDSNTSIVPKVPGDAQNTGHRWTYYSRVIAGCCTSIRHHLEKTQNVMDSTRRQLPASSTFGVQSGSTIVYSECGDQLWPKNTALNDYQPNSLAEMLAEPKWLPVSILFQDEPSAGEFAYAVANIKPFYWSGKVTKYRQHALWVKRGSVPGWAHGAVLIVWDDMDIVQDSTYGKKQVLWFEQSNLQATGSASDLRFTSADGRARVWRVTSGLSVEVEHVSGFKDLDGVTYPTPSDDDQDDSLDGVWRAQINPATAAGSFSNIRVYFIGPATETTHPVVTNIDDATWRGVSIGGTEMKMKKGTSFQASVAGTGGATLTTSITTTRSTTTLSTTTRSTTSQSTQPTTTQPGIVLPSEEGELPATMPQKNPILDKPAARLGLAGLSSDAPLLAGLGMSLRVSVDDGEELHRWRIFSDSGFNNELTWILEPDQDDEDPHVPDAKTTVILGIGTDTGPTSVRNYVEWITSFGTTRRQFWVRDPPVSGGIYVGNQECQSDLATFAIDPGDPITFGISILPEWDDEFRQQSEYDGNRYAQTLRMWGGASTAEVFLDDVRIIGERDIADIEGFYWSNPSIGDHQIEIVLRAARESIYTVTLTGTIRVEVA